MKRLLSILLVGVFVFSLAACAKKAGQEGAKVKCPACGYEFEVPYGR